MKLWISYLLLLTLTVMLVGCGVSKTDNPSPTPVLTKAVISFGGDGNGTPTATALSTPIGKLTLQKYNTPTYLYIAAFDQNNAPLNHCDGDPVQFKVTSTLNPLQWPNPLTSSSSALYVSDSYSPDVAGNDTVSVEAFCESEPATTVSTTANIIVTSNAITTITLALNNTDTAALTTVTTADGFDACGLGFQLNWVATPPPNGGLAPIPCQGSGSNAAFSFPAVQSKFEICSLTATFTSGGTTVVSNTLSYDSPVPE